MVVISELEELSSDDELPPLRPTEAVPRPARQAPATAPPRRVEAPGKGYGQKSGSLDDLDDSDDDLPPLIASGGSGGSFSRGRDSCGPNTTNDKASAWRHIAVEEKSDDSDDMPPRSSQPGRSGIGLAAGRPKATIPAGPAALAKALAGRGGGTGSVSANGDDHSLLGGRGTTPPAISASAVAKAASKQREEEDDEDDELPPLMNNRGGSQQTPRELSRASAQPALATQDPEKLLALAEAQLAAEQLEEARRHAMEARTLLRRPGSDEALAAKALLLLLKAQLAHECSDDIPAAANEAVHAAADALTALRQVGDVKGQAAALQAQMNAYFATMRYRQAVEAGTEALALYRSVGDTHGYAAQLLDLPKVHLARGEVQESLANAQKAAALYKRIGRKKSEGVAWLAVAEAKLGKSESEEVLRTTKLATSLLGECRMAASAWRIAGVAYLKQGVKDQALTNFHQALAIARSFSHRAEIGRCLDQIMQTYASSPLRAVREMEDEVQQARRAKDLVREAQALHRAAIVFREDRPKEALMKAGEALKILKRDGTSKDAEACVLQTIAELYLAARDRNEALKVAEQAQALLRELDNTRGVVGVLQLITSIHLEMEEPRKALQSSFEQRAVYQRAGYKEDEAASMLGVADMLHEMQETTRAVKTAKEARMLFQAMDDPRGETHALFTLAQLQQANQAPAEALRSAKEALALSKEVGDNALQANASDVLAHMHLTRADLSEAANVAEDLVKACKQKSSDELSSASGFQVAAAIYSQLANSSQGRGANIRWVREALQNAEAALKTFRALDNKPGIAAILQTLAHVQLLSGRRQDILDSLKNAKEAAEVCSELQDGQGMGSALLLAAQSCLNTDEATEALQLAQEASELFQQVGDAAAQKNAMEIHRMAQEALAEQRSKSPASASRFSQEASRAKRLSASESHARATSPSSSSPGHGRGGATAGVAQSEGSAPNGTRRGGLGFNSHGRNPFELG